MLRYLLLTGEPAPLLWCEAIAQRGDALIAVYALDSVPLSAPSQSHPAIVARHFSRPEDIDVPQDCDAVLIAGSDPRLFAAARQLGLAGLPLLVVTTHSGPTSALFELISLWEEGQTLLVPAFSSGLEQVTEHLALNGPLERIEFVRDVESTDSTRPLLAESTVHRWFFQDVRWLTRLATNGSVSRTGSWENVQAIWTGKRGNELAQGMVTLSGDHVPEANWSIRPTASAPCWTLTLWSGGPPVVLTSSEHAKGLTSDISAALEQFADAVQGKPNRSWNDVLQCGHLLAAVQRSAQRQRKVPVHFEEVSERSQFKTQMSAIGCGVLLWAMFGIILMLAVAGTMDPRDREQRTSQAAGFVLSEADFSADASSLSDSGLSHVQQIADDWSSTTAPVVFDTTAIDSKAIERCQQQVRKILEDKNLAGIDGRLIARPVTGVWFERLIFFGWVVVFGPLAFFLLAQLLIAASHPGRHDAGEATTTT